MRRTVLRLRKRIMHWMWDGRPEWTEVVPDSVVARPLCWLVGHEPICDQCHKPDHDFCCWCQKPMPGQAHKAKERTNGK